VLAEDYVRALAGRDVLRREVDAALGQHDALVLPTLPIPAPLSARRPSKWERRPSRCGTSCSAHTALQCHGAPGDLIARRPYGVGPAVRSPARRGAADRQMCSCAWRSAASVTDERFFAALGTRRRLNIRRTGRRRNVRWRHRFDVRRRLVDADPADDECQA
jgi:hypothetical protein